MKAIIEIPDDKNVYVIAGRTVIYRKEPGGPLLKKVVFCNFCGECCRHSGWRYNNSEGQCRFLRYERNHHDGGKLDEGWFCKLRGDYVPFSCVKGRGTPDKCVIRFEAVKWQVQTSTKLIAE